MIEYVFRHSRMVGGKKILSRVFCGRYAIEKGAKPVTVRLNTPDREIARKRLRAIVLEKQREQEGIIAPKAVRVAATTPLAELVAAGSVHEVLLRMDGAGRPRLRAGAHVHHRRQRTQHGESAG